MDGGDVGQTATLGKCMHRVLIVEDTPADVRQSTAVVKKLGASDVIALNNIAAAILFLQDVWREPSRRRT